MTNWNNKASLISVTFASSYEQLYMSRELKIGIITLVTLAIMIWGFQYMKGKNLLSKGYTFEASYPDVEGISVASPVQINGLPVGNVSSIRVNPNDVKSMIVTFDIEGDFQLPTSTKALIASPSGVVGSKRIILSYDQICDGTNCLEGGEMLEGGYRGIISTLVSGDEIDGVLSGLRTNLGPMMDSILLKVAGEEAENSIASSMRNMDLLSANLASATGQLNRLLSQSTENITETMSNIAVVTGSFAKTHEDLEKLITNFSALSEDLASADLGATLSKTTETIEGANSLLSSLESTVDKTSTSLTSVNSLLQKIDTGQGTMGRLMNDPEIYHNLKATSEHLALLLQDLRLNPKRYVKLSVFGKKDQPYTPSDEDPALDDIQRQERN